MNLSGLFTLTDLKAWFIDQGHVMPDWIWDQVTLSEMTVDGWEKTTRVGKRRKVHRPTFVGTMAKLMKLEFGQLVETRGEVRKASMFMVQKKARDIMNAMHVRTEDQAECIAKIIALSFIPSRSETEARQMMKSAAAFSANRAFDATYISWYDIVSWCEWFLGTPFRRV